MTELWRTTLERAQERFEAVSRKYPPLRCLLVEQATPEQREREMPVLGEFSRETVMYYGGGLYREMNILHNPDGTAIFAETAVLDVNGKPISNTVGEAFAVERGALRHIQVHGHHEAFKSFSMIADEAGCAIAAYPPELRKLLPLETVRERNSQERWIYTLFDLAWRGVPGSSLRAERLVWVKNVTIPLHALLHFRRQAAADRLAPPDEVLSQIPDPPDRFYSTLDNLAAASVAAIDVLLAAATTEKASQVDLTRVHVAPPSHNPALLANPNVELLRLAEKRIGLEIVDQGKRLQNAIARGMEEMVAAGALNSSATLRMLLGNCCDAISERVQIAWRTIQEHITTAGVVYHDGLRDELKEAVGAHVPEDHADVAATLREHLKRIRLYNLQLHEKERLDLARKNALDKVSGEIDLLVLSLKNRQALVPAAGSPLNLQFNAPVGTVQFGNSNVANVTQQWTTENRDSLTAALRGVEDAIRSVKMPATASKDDLLALVKAAKNEMAKDKPDVSRLRTTLSGVAATIRTVGSLPAAYLVLKVAAAKMGFHLP